MFPSGPPDVVDASRLPRLQPATVSVTFDKATSHPPTHQSVGTSGDFMATITKAKYLTSSIPSDRVVLWLELDTAGMGTYMTYVPGDSIGVRCPNNPDVVAYFVRRLSIATDDLHIGCTVQSIKKNAASKSSGSSSNLPTTSLFQLLTHHYDLEAQVKKSTLRALATYCDVDSTDQRALLYLSSKDGPLHFQNFVESQHLSVVDILRLFPTCRPPLASVLSLLPTLSPRYYSLASSPLSSQPHKVHIAFTIVEYALPVVQGGTTSRLLRRRGLCTSWLHALARPLLHPQTTPVNAAVAVQIPIFHHPTKDFTLPANPSYPLILIGPGTGVTPFVGFLQHRQLQRLKHVDDSESCGTWRGNHAVELVEHAFELGQIDLFFGCRHRHQDFLFQRHLDSFIHEGVLTHLHVAASREQAKHYVQHDVAEHGAAVYDLVARQGGYVYVCGDGMHMAKDVHAALVQVFVEHGHMTHQEAEVAWKDLALRQRYVRDIWG
ncbi:hypothetical protein DYB37_008087 [Aphanomyces astaci]|uniref:FAD-binding FR-type domain-containing protein n=1 Tax=Aphanomyces astaci TaxID=112090 RepID=A0A3R7A403_APHAT|nr:hypothetical protein DYB37_008087 [Aphanomyces astaci]